MIFYRLRMLFLLGSVLFVYSSAGHAQDPTDACLAFRSGLSLGAPLAYTKAKFDTGGTLTIVALGSSSTTGFGLFRSGGAFPEVMKRELLRLRPSARITLINSGHIMDDLPGNVARLDNEVLRHKPDLVVWQIGTNDVVWRGIANNAKEMLSDAVRRLRTANTDVVLLDLQYAPLVLATGRHIRMEKIIVEVAGELKVGHFPRFLLMKRAIEANVRGLVLWDGLHSSAEGHECVGIALAEMIDAATR